MSNSKETKELTAMQTMIEFIEKNYDWFIAHSPEYGVVPKILAKATELLTKEREQMVNLSNHDREEWVKVEDVIEFKKNDWDNFKLRMGNRCYQGLINIEDFATIIGELEDKKL